MTTTVIANACRYAGPDATDALTGPGNRVFCHDRTFGAAAARAAFEAEHPGSTALEATSPEGACAEALGITPTIDVLVCNHFLSPEAKPIAETGHEEFRQTLESLLVEPHRFVTALLPALSRSGNSRIIMVTSAAPLKPGKGVTLYTAARAGANSMVETLAKELGPDGIAVFGIAPNYFASDDTYSRVAFEKSERFRASVERNVPLGRLSNDDEMTGLIRYLADDSSSFITGQVIAFTGGWA